MQIIEQLQSKRGVTVTVERHYCPDSGRVPYIAVRYGAGRTRGTVSYYLENEACAGLPELVRDFFLQDRNNLGRPIKVGTRHKNQREAA